MITRISRMNENPLFNENTNHKLMILELQNFTDERILMSVFSDIYFTKRYDNLFHRNNNLGYPFFLTTKPTDIFAWFEEGTS